MAIRKVNFALNEYYHVYNRGNGKQKIFHDKEDYDHFAFLLLILNTDKNIELRNHKKQDKTKSSKDKKPIAIGAYVLMPNHFHILITEKQKGGVSKFMQKISTAYVMYYNKKYNRTGSLFEGKFKAKHLNTDNYLKYTFSYIHLNPIKFIDKNWKESGLKNKKETFGYLAKYTYSSYLDYLGENRWQNNIIGKNDFPKYFPDNRSFTREILTWLEYKE